MRPQVFNKFLSSITVCTAMLFYSGIKAQIVYTDVKPDSVINGSYPPRLYNLDLNNDGVNDFTFHVQFLKGRCAECGPQLKSHVYVFLADTSRDKILNDTSDLPYNLPALAIIDGSGNHWSSVYGQTLRDSFGCGSCGGFKGVGNWIDSTDKYLGLRLIIGSNNYYGWARISVAVTSNFTRLIVRDYAYNSISNQPIRAGQKSCIAPAANISANGPLSFCLGDSVTFTAKDGYEYQWKRNGKNIVGATSKKYTAKIAGIYKCKVTNSCGTKTSNGDTVTITCKGLFNNVVSNDKKIFLSTPQLKTTPNPFSNSTTISFSLQLTQKVSVSIYDMNGKVIKKLADAQMQQGLHQLIWNAKDEKENAVTSGIYVLKLQAGNYSETKKISVIK